MEAGIFELLVLIGVVVLWVWIVRDWLYRRSRAGETSLSPSLEHRLLRVAKAEGGEVTATTVALSLGVSLAEAHAALDRLCAQGFAEMDVAEDGVIVYRFPELLHDRPSPAPHLRSVSDVDDENPLRRS
jgi:hypothetical protein